MEATHGAARVTGGRRRPRLAPAAVREARGVAEIGREQEGWRQAGAAGSSVWGAARPRVRGRSQAASVMTVSTLMDWTILTGLAWSAWGHRKVALTSIWDMTPRLALH